jgi:anthranilate phosphoribosyltransferase
LIKQSIAALRSGESLEEEQMAQVIDSLMKGESSDRQIASLLSALHEKGETVEELSGTARALRWHMTPIQANRENVVDTCGTGGGAMGTFNISTAAAIVAASAGASVAKHGNRKSTSKTGSADVLQELGVNLECSVATVEKCLNQIGVCFCFAPLFHPSVANVMSVRRKLKHPTIFNLVGPLCNPAQAPYQILGAGRAETRVLLAEALARLGTTRSLVVHGRDGLGELSNSGITDVTEVCGHHVVDKILAPADFGMQASSSNGLKAHDPQESGEKILQVLAGKPGPSRDVVVINAAAALWVSGISDNLQLATERCESAIDNGHSRQTLDELVEITNSG